MTNVKERFKPLKNFPGYFISENGTVYNSKKDKIVKQTSYGGGYLGVCIKNSKNNRRNFLVHRLVAETFIWNGENKPFVNHKDGNKQNPRLENLEWCTAKENSEHAIKYGLTNFKNNSGVENAHSKLNPQSVLKIRRLYKYNGLTQTEIAQRFNITQANVNLIIKNKAWKQVPQF
jgi:DNA-binding XRE family transcriptional regulator